MKIGSNRIGYNDIVYVVVRKEGRVISTLRDSEFNSIGSAISTAIDRLPVPAKEFLPLLTFDVSNIEKGTYGTYNYKYRKIG